MFSLVNKNYQFNQMCAFK